MNLLITEKTDKAGKGSGLPSSDSLGATSM
jgi:hypothetical protein